MAVLSQDVTVSYYTVADVMQILGCKRTNSTMRWKKKDI